jgi:hypothetical protein
MGHSQLTSPLDQQLAILANSGEKKTKTRGNIVFPNAYKAK